jgi:hypothetical protein
MSEAEELPKDDLQQIVEDTGADIDEVRESYQNMREFGVDQEEALRGTASKFNADSVSVDEDRDSSSDIEELGELVEMGKEWTAVEARVFGAWEPSHPSIQQTGHLVDGTGVVRFVVWEKSDAQPLDIGESYRLGGVTLDEYDGPVNVQVNSETTVSAIDHVDSADGVSL